MQEDRRSDAQTRPGRLAVEAARRGLTLETLSQETGLSYSTVAKANAGGRVSTKTLGLLGRALQRHAVIPEVDALLGLPSGLAEASA